MLTVTLYNMHIYIDADYNKENLSRLDLYFTSADTQMLC